jgi:FkbM family methyltransferase
MRALIAMAGRLASFVDVGANVGIYSLLLAATNPSMPVHAVEPVPAIFARLRRNAELNGFPTLWLHQVAASDSTGETVIHVPTNQAVPIEASLVAGFRPETTTVPVQAITIDALVSQAGIPEVGLLKVDTEGATRRVLDGAVATLCRDAPFVICEILSGWDNGEGLGQMMADLGYQAYRLAARGPERVERVRGDPTYADLNFLFVHRDRTGEVPSRW